MASDTNELISEAAKRNWQRPEYRARILASQRKTWNRRMKARLNELAKGAEK